MGQRVLLVSEQAIRDNVDFSDSLNSKSIITAIYEAQTFYLASVIGDKMLKELYLEVSNGTLTTANKTLLDTYIQPFVIAQSAGVLATKINYHVGNAGVTKDANAQSPKQLVDYYNNLAGIALKRLTDFLCKHFSDYSTLLNGVEGIKAHLSASDQTSIFLGSPVVNKYPIDPGYKR